MFTRPNRHADTSWKALVFSRHALNFVAEAYGNSPSGPIFVNITIRSGSGKGRGFNSTVLTTEKIATLAPIPSVNVRTATTLETRLFTKHRKPKFRSCHSWLTFAPASAFQ